MKIFISYFKSSYNPSCKAGVITLKAIFCIVFFICINSFNSKHPVYIGITELKHDSKTKSLNVSIRLFTSDFETALKKATGQKIDLLHPKIKASADTVLFTYIKKHFGIRINNKLQKLQYLGYEQEEESIWTYIEIKGLSAPKEIIIENTLLYDYFSMQQHIIHAEVSGVKKSSKLTNPDKQAILKF